MTLSDKRLSLISRTPVIAGFVLALLLGSQGLAQNSPATPASQGDTHTLNLQDADIRLLIETVADITGKNFIVDPSVSGKVTVISGHPVPAAEIYDTFLAVLSVNGLTAIDTGKAIKIVPDVDAAPRLERNNHGEDFVTRIIKLKYVPVTQAATLLKSLNNKAKIISHANSNTLVISERKNEVDRLQAIVRAIDKKSDASLEMIPVRYANARDLAQTIEGLTDTGNSGPKVKVVADERSNSILVNADAAQKAKVRALVAQLDQPLASDSQSQVIYLRYADAETLVPILEKLTRSGPEKDSAQGVSIQAHKETNSLVINAPPPVLREITHTIQKLDIRRPQVRVEAIIAEVSLDFIKELGVQWQGLSAGGVGGGTNFGTRGNILGLTSVEALSTLNQGINLGFIDTNSEGNVQLGVLLSALASNTNNNILSTPSVVTLNHKEAKLTVGQEVPFVTGQYTNTGNNNGAASPFQTIQREDVGITLTVTPHINDGDQIVMDISQEVSSIAQTSQNAVDLITNKRTLNTSVMVPNNEILVLGGLIDENVQETVSKVPVLGDIPVIRNLFRHKKKTKIKRNLMVFLRPVILRDNATQKELTGKAYDSIRELQLKANARDHDKRVQPLLPATEPSREPQQQVPPRYQDIPQQP
jgi:general secretion pathway protein D